MKYKYAQITVEPGATVEDIDALSERLRERGAVESDIRKLRRLVGDGFTGTFIIELEDKEPEEETEPCEACLVNELLAAAGVTEPAQIGNTESENEKARLAFRVVQELWDHANLYLVAESFLIDYFGETE